MVMKQASRQLLRALRGGRSQVQLARRLGYKANPVAKWEGGYRFPTAVETLRIARVVGVDVEAAVEGFHPPAAEAWREGGLSGWLEALRGDASQAEVAGRAGLSRQQVGRALRGDTMPRLPEFLALLDGTTQRVHDFVARLVDVEQVPALADRVQRARAIRRLAFAHPWSPAALAILDTLPREASGAGRHEALRSALGLTDGDASALLAAIREAGADGPDNTGVTVDVRPTRADQLALRTHWSEVMAERMRRAERAALAGQASPTDDVLSLNVFAVSRDDLERIRELQRAFFREVRDILAESEPEVAAMLLIHTGVFGDRGT